ncbi:MAG: SPOR domain-containing protein [Betaproteobacteria bacterium]|nr:SPOR domain-containing protein [Betaproteobacteria bacterium]
MKLFVIILILVNAIFLAWTISQHAAPQSVPSEYHPDRIQLISQSLPPTSVAQPTPASLALVQGQALQHDVAPVKDNPVTSNNSAIKTAVTSQAPDKTTAPLAPACFAWGPIDAAHLVDAQTQLNQLHLGERMLSNDDSAAKGPFWVYYPPLANKQAADAELAVLKNQGIQDIAIVRNGPWQNALSMGLYGKASGAQQRLNQLKKMGLNGQIEAFKSPDRQFLFIKLNPTEQTAVAAITHHFTISAMQAVPCPTP